MIRAIKDFFIENGIGLLLGVALIFGISILFLRTATLDDDLYLRETMIMAEVLGQGEWIGNYAVGIHGFLFKLPVALVFLLTGPSLLVATIWTVILGLLSIYFFYLILQKLFNSNLWALAGATLLFTNFQFILNYPTYMREIPVLLCLLLVIYCILFKKSRWLLGLSLLFVLEAKEYVMLMIAPAILIYIFYTEWGSLKNIFIENVKTFLPSLILVVLMIFTTLVPLNTFLLSTIGVMERGVEYHLRHFNIESATRNRSSEEQKQIPTIQTPQEEQPEVVEIIEEEVQEEFEPMVTFTFDDGRASDYHVMLPLFNEKGIKGCSAIITQRPGGANRVTWDEIRELEASGWEIMSHTMDHVNLEEADEATIRSELEGSLDKLTEEGLTVKNLAYPYNANNALARSVAAEFYRSARARAGVINSLPLNNLYRLSAQRLDPGDEIEPRIERIDEAYEENKWLIFYTHAVEADSEHYEIIEEIIDYILFKGIPIVTINQGLDILGIPQEGIPEVVEEEVVEIIEEEVQEEPRENIFITLINTILLYIGKLLYPYSFSFLSIPKVLFFPALLTSIFLFSKFKKEKKPEFMALTLMLLFYFLIFVLKASFTRYIFPITPIVIFFFILFLKDLIHYKKTFLITILITLALVIGGLFFEEDYLLVKILLNAILMILLFLYLYFEKARSYIQVLIICLIAFFSFSVAMFFFYSRGQIHTGLLWGRDYEVEKVVTYFKEDENVFLNDPGWDLLPLVYRKDTDFEPEFRWELKEWLPRKESLKNLGNANTYKLSFKNMEDLKLQVDYYEIDKIGIVTSRVADYKFPYQDRLTELSEQEWIEFHLQVMLQNKNLYIFIVVDEDEN